MTAIRRATICGGTVALMLAALVLAVAGLRTAPLDAKAAGAVAVAAPTPAEQSDLLLQYKPILYLHDDERWPPVKVDEFIRDAQLEKQVRNDSWRSIQRKNLPTSKEGCSFTPCFRFNLPCDLEHRGARCFVDGAPRSDWRQATVYGNFVEVRHTLRLRGLKERPAYLLRYWYFYYFDDWRTQGRWIWQVHEGDWEAVTIGLSASREPLFAAYSQHCEGAWREWSGSGILKQGDHPVVYVALGSHAHYFRPINQPVYLLRCKYSQDKAGQALRWLKEHTKGDRLFDQAEDPRSTATPTSLEVLLVKQPRWTSFQGVWSEGDYLYTAPLPTRFNRTRIGEGPKTPAFFSDRQKDFWHETTS